MALATCGATCTAITIVSDDPDEQGDPCDQPCGYCKGHSGGEDHTCRGHGGYCDS